MHTPETRRPARWLIVAAALVALIAGTLGAGVLGRRGGTKRAAGYAESSIQAPKAPLTGKTPTASLLVAFSPSTPVVGQPVTVTVTVVGTPSGTQTLTWRLPATVTVVSPCPTTLAGRTASCVVVPQTPGPLPVTVSLSGTTGPSAPVRVAPVQVTTTVAAQAATGSPKDGTTSPAPTTTTSSGASSAPRKVTTVALVTVPAAITVETGNYLAGYASSPNVGSGDLTFVITVWVKITGTTFASSDKVYFGSVEATTTFGNGPSAITAEIPPSCTGLVTVVVTLTGVLSRPAPFDCVTHPAISTSSLPGGTVGTPYSVQLAATGGTGAYRWALPYGPQDGLSLSATGKLSGTPTSSGKFTLLVTLRTSKSGDFAKTERLVVTVAS